MKGTLCLALLAILELSFAHRTDRLLGTCPSGWDEAGYICFKYNHEDKDLMKAWKSCHRMENSREIDQDFIEDKSMLLTVGKLYEFIRDGHEVSEYFHHTVRLNAIKSGGKWWDIQKLPDSHFHYKDVSNLLGHAQEITANDAEKIGFGMDAAISLGEDGDGLIFNPKEKTIKIADADFEFPYVCTHKRNNRAGGRCPGALAECNDRGNCFYGLCECYDGYYPDNCSKDPPHPLTTTTTTTVSCLQEDIAWTNAVVITEVPVEDGLECIGVCVETAGCDRFTYWDGLCFPISASTGLDTPLPSAESGTLADCL